ncbi:MAG: glycosyltransferase [Pelotomaculum sp.]|nr:glycosyltransferase [Pelotomaculum sp.]
MDRPALVIMSRVPSPEGKSRLSGILTPEQRELLQWAFLLDMLDKVRTVRGAAAFIAAAPADRLEELRRAVGGKAEVVLQPAGDLGGRMLAVSRHIFNLGYSPVVLIGADVPALPPACLSRAIELLGRYQMVFGPSPDGGYYLAGARHPEERIFKDIDWGSGSVLEKTLAVCKRCGLTWCLLEPLEDVDRPADLLELAGRVKRGQFAPGAEPFRTIKFIKENF